jgi:hypothetical protein
VTAPHDAPSVAELVEAVREWLERDVSPAVEGRLRFHARVAVNALTMVERELAVGAAQQAAHHARLATLGVSDDGELADRIRARTIDIGPAERRLLRDAVVDKLRVANPAYLDSGDREPVDGDERTDASSPVVRDRPIDTG